MAKPMSKKLSKHYLGRMRICVCGQPQCEHQDGKTDRCNKFVFDHLEWPRHEDLGHPDLLVAKG